jgi:hypothetical protein
MSKEQDSIIRKGGDRMNGSRGKRLLIVVIACLAAFALLAGVAVAATSVGGSERCCTSGEGEGKHGPRGNGNHEEMQGVIADTLGISSEELQSELESGKTVAQLAEEKGISVDAVVDAMTAKIFESIDQAVADGNLDAEKAEEIKSGTPDRVRERIENGPPERGHGPGGECGPRGENGPPERPGPETEDAEIG